MPEQNTDPRAPAQPMDPRHLARLKTLATKAAPDTPDSDWGDPETWRGLGDSVDADFHVASYIAASRPSVMLRLLADRDRLAADARHLTEALCIVLGCKPGAHDLGDLLGERLGDLGLGDARISAVVSSTLSAAVKPGTAGS